MNHESQLSFLVKFPINLGTRCGEMDYGCEAHMREWGSGSEECAACQAVEAEMTREVIVVKVGSSHAFKPLGYVEMEAGHDREKLEAHLKEQYPCWVNGTFIFEPTPFNELTVGDGERLNMSDDDAKGEIQDLEMMLKFRHRQQIKNFREILTLRFGAEKIQSLSDEVIQMLEEVKIPCTRQLCMEFCDTEEKIRAEFTDWFQTIRALRGVFIQLLDWDVGEDYPNDFLLEDVTASSKEAIDAGVIEPLDLFLLVAYRFSFEY